jgi:hypothetical protein
VKAKDSSFLVRFLAICVMSLIALSDVVLEDLCECGQVNVDVAANSLIVCL